MGLENYRFDIKKTKEYLEDDATYAFVLLAILLAYLPEGEDDLTKIELDQVILDMQDDFSAKIPDEVENKILAAIVALTTDYFWTNVNVMKGIALTFDDGDVGSLIYDDDEDVDACQVLWAAMEVGLINDLKFEESLDLFTNSVAKVINNIVESEAEDKDEIADDVDTIDEAVSTPYYGRIINGKLMLMCGLLINLAGENDKVRNELEQVAHEILSDNDINTQQPIGD